ncbi:hypothetical protein MMC08_002410 [Hypocenomyce scalaris]|nr:hypothetical protein [Hypocenomyce scalaris]
MKPTLISAVLFAAASGALAQNNASTPNGCNAGFYPGADTVLYNVAYTFSQVLSIIGDFQNITWNGVPYNSVTLNGTDNTVGTARTYEADGALVTETLTVFEKPAAGPFVEVTAFSTTTIANTSFYSDFNSIVVTPICGGAAATFNFTVDFCADNSVMAAAFFHMVHLSDAVDVGQLLGGRNYTSCAALEPNSSTTAAASPGATGATFTGGASVRGLSALLAGGAAIAAFV